MEKTVPAESCKLKKRNKYFSNMDKGALTCSDMKHPKYVALYIFFVLFMLVYFLIAVVPAVWIVLSGFKDTAEIYAIPVKFFPEKINLSKLADAWKQMNFLRCYFNTTVMSLGSVAADITLCGLMGYVLSRLKPKGSGFVHALCFTLMMLPANMRMIPLYKEFISFPIGGFNLMNTYWPIWIMSGATLFDIILFKTSFDNVSISLIEAAKIDGASNMRIFFKVVLPLSMPVVVTVGIFSFNSHFGAFFWPLLTLKDERVSVLGLKLYQIKNSTMNMDYKMLAILFSILPQMLVFALFQKYIMGGISLGGVKG